MKWRLRYQNIKEKLLPEGTFRRRYYDALRKIIHLVLTQGFKQGFFYIKEKFTFKLKDRLYSGYETSISCFSDIIPLSKLKKENLHLNYGISVVTVIYNNSVDELRDFIKSLNESSTKIKELIVVDNSDKKDFSSFFKHLNFPSKINYIKTKKNVGFGKGVNLGIKHSNEEFILVINPDAKLKEDTLEFLFKMLILNKGVALAEALHVPYEHPKYYNPITLEPVWASGCCFLVKKSSFQRIGGFDENIFLYAEDVDLSWRFKSAGFKIKYVPLAKVCHDSISPRLTMAKYSPLSNLYLRLKYGSLLNQSLREWLLLTFFSFRKKVCLKDFFHYFKAGLVTRKSLRDRDKYKKYVYFDSLSFGYEPFRRRGYDVPLINLKDFPKVSIIVRTHNRAELLHRAILSIANQTYPEIEVIVVEDKSDVALRIIKNFKELNIKYFKVFEGRTKALNKGLSEAEGRYIMFLDDDDLIFSDAVELLVSYAEKEGVDFVYAGSIKFETDDKISGVLKYSYFEPFNREKIMRENYIPMGSFIISKKLVEKVGFFDESLEYLEDWDYIRRAAKIEDFFFVPKDILIYCVPKDKDLFYKRQTQLDKTYKKVIKKDLHSL